jgi:hypothetical protein
MGYTSFFSELANLDQTDPSGYPSATVAVIKGVMLLLAVIALIATLSVPSRMQGGVSRG